MANGKTHSEIYSVGAAQLRKTKTSTLTGPTLKTAMSPALVRSMDGSTLKTIYQTAGGVHIAPLKATSLNNINEQDDTLAYRTYPLSVAWRWNSTLLTGMPTLTGCSPPAITAPQGSRRCT